MYFIETNGRKLGPYDATMSSKTKEGPIERVLYDAGLFELTAEKKEYRFWLRESKNFFGKVSTSIDIIDMWNGEFFTLQAKNLFFFRIIDNDPKIIAQIGDELRLYEDFGRSNRILEPDGDKKDLVPLGYNSIFVQWDDPWFKPIIFDTDMAKIARIERFGEYYGFRSYTDVNGADHFVLFIQDENSTEAVPNWYWVDNFVRVSERIDLASDQYVENWSLDSYGNIYFDITNGQKYHIDRGTGKMISGPIPDIPKHTFVFTRIEEDTDDTFIVAQNENGFFIISHAETNISEADKKKIRYFPGYVRTIKPKNANSVHARFLMRDANNLTVLVNELSEEIAGTDISQEEKILSAEIQNATLTVTLENGEKRSFLVG